MTRISQFCIILLHFAIFKIQFDFDIVFAIKRTQNKFNKLLL